MGLVVEWAESRGRELVASVVEVVLVVVVPVLSRYRWDRRRRDGWRESVCIHCQLLVEIHTESRARPIPLADMVGIPHRVAALDGLFLFAGGITVFVSSAQEPPGPVRDFFRRR